MLNPDITAVVRRKGNLDLQFHEKIKPVTLVQTAVPMRGSRKFCQRGFNSGKVFFNEGKEDANSTEKRAIIGLPGKRHLNGVLLACQWWPNIECWLGSFVIFRGSGCVLLKIPIFLWFFFCGGGGGVQTQSLLWISTWDQSSLCSVVRCRLNEKSLEKWYPCVLWCYRKTESINNNIKDFI